MRNRDYSAASDFLRAFFGDVTSHDVEIRALPNERGAGRAAPLFTRDSRNIEAHCSRWDDIGRAVYFAMATRLRGMGLGTRQGLAELSALWSDIDCIKLGLDKSETNDALLTKMLLPPSATVDSGWGVHAYWWLKESLDIQHDRPDAAESDAEIVAALQQLAAITAGDPAVCDLARIMRLPGTFNTKRDELRPCHVLSMSGARYEYSDILEMLDTHRPVIIPATNSTRTREAPSDAFLRYAQACGMKPPIDVGARLAAMTYLGAGDSGIHQTQLHVSASLVRHGATDDEIAALLIQATQEAVGVAGAAWNWKREEANIRAMIATARAKFGAAPVIATEAEAKPESAAEAAEAWATQDNRVVNLAEARRARGRPRKEGVAPDSLIAKTGEAVIGYWTATHGRLAVVEAQAYTYREGIWERWGPAEHHTLKAAIQGILKAAQIDPKTQLLNAVYRYVLESPELLASGVEWDATGYIVCADGVLVPDATLAVGWRPELHSPDHWATQRVEINIKELGQECPQWLAFLDGCFSDRALDERASVIAALQEWFGAAVVRRKPRELRKALWLHGESRTGKTRVLEVLRLLIGNPTSSMKVRALEKNFGASALIGRRAWIADDAVGANDEVDDATFKVVVTGEWFTTDVKHAAHASLRLDIPVAFSSNALPKVKDQSEGVFNRSILIPMRVVRSEEETSGRPMIEDIVAESEKAGVFGWALEGWNRLKKRGMFAPPQSMREASEAFRDQNNPVLAWAREALKSDPLWMVDRRDLYASFKGWFIGMNGEGSKVPSQKFLVQGLRQIFGLGPHHVRDGYRLEIGITMTDEGLKMREAAPRAFGDEIGSGAAVHVNKVAPSRGS